MFVQAIPSTQKSGGGGDTFASLKQHVYTYTPC